MGKEGRKEGGKGGRDREARPRAALAPASSKKSLNDFYLCLPVEAASVSPRAALAPLGQGCPLGTAGRG